MDTDKKVFDVSKPVKAAEEKNAEADSSKDAAFSVPVRSNLNTPSEKPEVEAVAVVKHELKITPDATTEKPPEVVEETETAESEVVEESVTNTETASEEIVPVATNETSELKSEETSDPEAAPSEESTDAANATEGSSEETPTPAVEGEAESPNVFDTKQYHLPIKEAKTHNSGKRMFGFVVVFLLVVAIVGVVAVDAGWIDVGVKLPFDLIK